MGRMRRLRVQVDSIELLLLLLLLLWRRRLTIVHRLILTRCSRNDARCPTGCNSELLTLYGHAVGEAVTIGDAAGLSPRMMKLWITSVLFICSAVILGASIRDFANIECELDKLDCGDAVSCIWSCDCTGGGDTMIAGSASAESLFLKAQNFLWGL